MARKQIYDDTPTQSDFLSFERLYAILYQEDADGYALVPRQEADLRFDLLPVVQERAQILLGPTLFQMCLGRTGRNNQQRASLGLRNGRILHSNVMKNLRKMAPATPLRQRICQEVQAGCRYFTTDVMLQTDEARERLGWLLSQLLDELAHQGGSPGLIQRLRRTGKSCDLLLAHLVLLCVVGSDEGLDQTVFPEQPDSQILPQLMAPLTWRGVTYQFSGHTPLPPLVQLWWNRKKTDRLFQLIGSGLTSIGGVGKTTALHSLCRGAHSEENICLITLKDAYPPVEQTDGWLSLDQDCHPLLEYLRQKYRQDLTGWMLLSGWTFLMDGFNELSPRQRRQLCRDTAELHRRGACVLLTCRTDVRSMMDELDYAEQQSLWDSIETIQTELLSLEQRDAFLENFAGAENGPEQKLLTFLRSSPLGQSPFCLSMSLNVQANHGAADAWRPVQKAEPKFDSGGSALVELLFHYLLAQIQCSGRNAELERTGFLLTKVLPLAAFQKVQETVWQRELREDANADWDDAYLQSCIDRMLRLFRLEEHPNPILSAFPEGQDLVKLRTQAGRKESLITAALCSLSVQNAAQSISAALVRSELDVRSRWDFTHDNIRDFLAALHLSNALTLLSSGCPLQPEDLDILAVHMGWWNNSVLEQAYHLALRYIPQFSLSMPMPGHLPPEGQVIFAHIMSWLCRCGIALSQDVTHCRTCYFSWNQALVQAFPALQPKSPMRKRYIQSYILALCEMSTYRRGSDLKEAFQWALQAKRCHESPEGQAVLTADGYQYLAQCKKTGFQQVLNGTCTWPSVRFLLEEDDFAFSNRMLCAVEELLHASGQGEQVVKVWAQRFGFSLNLPDWAKSLAQLASGMCQVLSQAKLLVDWAPQEMRPLFILGYTAKALTVRAAIGTSGAALNGLGAMLQYQCAMQECNPDLKLYRTLKLPPPLQPKQVQYQDNEWHAYLFYQSIARIRRGSQSYSALKMAELILRRRVRLDPRHRQPEMGPAGLDEPFDPQTLHKVVEPLLRHALMDQGAMSSFWYGRYWEELAVAEPNRARRAQLLDWAEQCFDTEVRRISQHSLLEQREAVRKAVQSAAQAGTKPTLANDIVMRALIEWKRIQLARERPISMCQIFGDTAFFQSIQNRIRTRTPQLKDGFIWTPEELEEVRHRSERSPLFE